MLSVKNADVIPLDVYYVKEIKETIEKDGKKLTEIERKTIINPKDEYLNQDNVVVERVRRIRVKIMEVNEVGGIVAPKMYLVGLRICEDDYESPTFHLLVKNDEEFKRRLIKEIEYYLNTSHLFEVKVDEARLF